MCIFIMAKSLMEHGLPFELKQRRYKPEVEATMAEAKIIVQELREGKRKAYANADDMLRDLYV